MHRTLAAVVLAGLAAAVPSSPPVRGAAPAPSSPVTVASCAAAAFGSPRLQPVGNDPFFTAAAELNGDGHVDLVTLNFLVNEQSVSILLGDGAGGFGTAVTTAIGPERASALAVGDLDGDGHADLTVARLDALASAAIVSVLLGDGAGSFAAPVSYPLEAGITPAAVGLGDVDGDGDLDAVVASADGPTLDGWIHVLKGNGLGGFAAPTGFRLFVTPARPNDLTLADFNHDARLDLALTRESGLDIWLGDGLGGFGSRLEDHGDFSPTSVVAGDFNEDGHIDLAVGTGGMADPHGDARVAVLFGNGTGHFGALAALVAFDVLQIEAADMTADGHIDLVVLSTEQRHGNQFETFVAVLPGDGSGGFGVATPTVPLPRRGGMAIADFDGNGLLDLAAGGSVPVGDGLEGKVAVLLSLCGNVADLAVSLSETPDPVLSRRLATYTVQVVNNGPDLTGAALGLKMPPGMGFVSATASAGACTPTLPDTLPSDRTVRCSLEDLPAEAPDNVRTVTVVAKADTFGGLQTAVAVVVTSVHDPVSGNNVAVEHTLIVVPGGDNLTISAASGGGAALRWIGGDAQDGYVIGRVAGGVHTTFPPTGTLPPTLTSFVDPAPVAGEVNCYQVVPRFGGVTLDLSQVVCMAPDTASPPGALGDFSFALLDGQKGDLRWSAPGGQTGYVLRRYRAGGMDQSFLIASTLETFRAVTEPSCYVLVPLNGTTPIANSTALCGVPGMGTLADAAARLPRLPGRLR